MNNFALTRLAPIHRTAFYISSLLDRNIEVIGLYYLKVLVHKCFTKPSSLCFIPQA